MGACSLRLNWYLGTYSGPELGETINPIGLILASPLAAGDFIDDGDPQLTVHCVFLIEEVARKATWTTRCIACIQSITFDCD